MVASRVVISPKKAGKGDNLWWPESKEEKHRGSGRYNRHTLGEGDGLPKMYRERASLEHCSHPVALWGTAARDKTTSCRSGSVTFDGVRACKCAQSCLTLWDSMDCSPPGSFCPWDYPSKNTEWVAIFSSKGSSKPRDGTCVSWGSCIGRWIAYH